MLKFVNVNGLENIKKNTAQAWVNVQLLLTIKSFLAASSCRTFLFIITLLEQINSVPEIRSLVFFFFGGAWIVFVLPLSKAQKNAKLDFPQLLRDITCFLEKSIFTVENTCANNYDNYTENVF